MLPLRNNYTIPRLRMYLMMKIVLLFCLLTVVYQYSQCSYLSRLSELEQTSIKLSYSELIKEKRSINENKLAPFNAIVGIASSNVPAYSNGNDTYYSGEDNYLYGIFMGLKWQCVEYSRRWTFIRKSSTFGSIRGASDMWNELKYVERITDKKQFPLKCHSNGSPNPPINETYLIYPVQRDMPYGHVAVIVDVLPNAIRVAEQNFYFNYWPKNYSREIPVVFNNGLYYINDTYNVNGWMEIDDNQQLKPLDEITRKNLQIKNERILNSISSHLNNSISILLLSLMIFVSHCVFS